MNKFLLFSLLLTSFSALAAIDTELDETPILNTRPDKPEKVFTPYANHWLTTFGFENIKYDTIYNYQGAKKNFQPGQQDMWGGRLGWGGQLYLGKGFITTSRVEGYYMGSLFSKNTTAKPDANVDSFAESKTVGQIFGADLVQSIGWMFDMKTRNPIMGDMTYLTIEPFIEAGVGAARGFNKASYNYDTGPSGTVESYQRRVSDKLVNARVGLGVNMTARSGYFFYLKATQNSYNITDRKVSGSDQANQGPIVAAPDTSGKGPKMSVTSYAFGGGYKF